MNPIDSRAVDAVVKTYACRDQWPVRGRFEVDVESTEDAWRIRFWSDKRRPASHRSAFFGSALLTAPEAHAALNSWKPEEAICALIDRTMRAAYAAAVPSWVCIAFRIGTREPRRLRRAA